MNSAKSALKLCFKMSKQRPWNTRLTSLIVTLSKEPEVSAHAHARILEHPSISAAPLEGNYLPIVIEDVDARGLHRWLEALPGVSNVDVVFCATDADAD
ncbi:hypothetical protein QEH56_17120 [Pelagicoccus enzymogenes]|nr:hypothetical protein [Pelagicoccus enzymogenes]MDQ8199887.1 hypothetical protein [Pelagicoccus enzymogenes]